MGGKQNDYLKEVLALMKGMGDAMSFLQMSLHSVGHSNSFIMVTDFLGKRNIDRFHLNHLFLLHECL